MRPDLRRLSRRTLLTDFGAAGIGIIVLGACTGSSGDGTGASSPATNGSPPESDDAPATQPSSTAPPAADASADDPVPADTEAGDDSSGSAELRFEHVSLGFVSAYVLLRGSEAAVVDTGTSGSRADILAGLDALGTTPAAVRHIVLTHNHGDHVGGLSDLEADLTAATVYGGVGDIESVRSALTTQALSDGDEVFGLGVVATPGHTPGSISLFDVGTGLLLAGDAINGDGSGRLTGPNPDFTPDMDTATASVGRLAALSPTIAAFGHGGPPVTDEVTAQLTALARS